MNATLEPTPEQLSALAASDDPSPVVMINLLKFKATADGIDAADGITGLEAYGRYGLAVLEHLDRVGGEVLVTAPALASVIGPSEPEWDLVLAVRYPSRSAFVAMISDPGYLQIHGHRAAALADSRLIACASGS